MLGQGVHERPESLLYLGVVGLQYPGIALTGIERRRYAGFLQQRLRGPKQQDGLAMAILVLEKLPCVTTVGEFFGSRIATRKTASTR